MTKKKRPDQKKVFFFFFFSPQERADAPNAPDKKKEKATAPGFGEGATGSTKPNLYLNQLITLTNPQPPERDGYILHALMRVCIGVGR